MLCEGSCFGFGFYLATRTAAATAVISGPDKEKYLNHLNPSALT